jgi:hypothetical protein
MNEQTKKVTKKITKNVFYIWYLYDDVEGIMQTGLELSFRNSFGDPICYNFKELRRISSDDWIKKYIKKNIPYLNTCRIKLISKQSDFYVPTIIYAMSND